MHIILKDSSGIIEKYESHFEHKNPWPHLKSWKLKQETIQLFGKKVAQPRLSALYGNPGVLYRYSGKTFEALPWDEWLQDLTQDCSEICKVPFNTALLNYYRNGKDSMGLHADDEKELGENPTIASISFGAERRMVFRNKSTKEKIIVPLNNGDLLIMRGSLQHYWKHELPKQPNISEDRLNITLRCVRDI
jgi:alkylated DNA repair dioxygenase AlkB